MKIRLLGAHNLETRDSKLASLVVDGVLALDAGGLTTGLSWSEQSKIRAIFLTHHHFDHSRDIVTLGMNAGSWSHVDVYSLKESYDGLNIRLLSGGLYLDFSKYPSPENPSLRFHTVEANQDVLVDGYRITPIAVNHPVPAVGYQVVGPDGGSFFYTGDTGPGLKDCWNGISPRLLIAEVTGVNERATFLESVGHLCPAFLKQELIHFRQQKGYLPRVVVVHMDPRVEAQIRQELQLVAAELGVEISPGHEGMEVDV